MISRSLSRMASKSSLWRSWTADPTADYNKSLHKFPWLAREEDENGDDDGQHLAAVERNPPHYSSPLPSLREAHYPEWTTTIGRQPYGRINASDLERDSFEVSPEGSVTEPEVQSLREPMVERDAAAIEDPHLVNHTPSFGNTE